MAKSAANDKQYLELHRGKWRVTVSVPRHLHDALGTRLKQQLPTDSLTIANQLKWPIVNDFRALIAKGTGGGSDLTALAEEFKRQRHNARTDEELEAIDEGLSVALEAVLGRAAGIDRDPETGEESPRYAPEKVKQAEQFVRVVAGKATLIDRFHPQYMAQLTVKPRTQGDDTRALELLRRWCAAESVDFHLQSFASKKAAVRFADGLQELEPKLSPVTLNKYLKRLSRYWQWLSKREEVPGDVWQGVLLPVPVQAHDEKERPFTTVEMNKLLSGDAPPEMHDIIRIAALTGCRLDPIVCLRVRDCENGTFMFKPQKKEQAPRACPIHSDLKEIIERRTKDKAPDDPIFPEWPAPQKSTSNRERSFKTSNEFTAYRRKVGVKDELEGRRRSLVNFHSFRRWFITEAERADQSGDLIAAVVGQKRAGITLGLYSAGPKLEQARRVVEAVKLPI